MSKAIRKTRAAAKYYYALGAVSVFDMPGTILKREVARSRTRFRRDAANIASDWDAVGRDIAVAAKKVARK